MEIGRARAGTKRAVPLQHTEEEKIGAAWGAGGVLPTLG